jgi:hypothetical protein
MSSPLFGVRVAGVPLLLPQGVPLEYLAAAPVYPLPRAGRGVLGLTQLRGHPVVVLVPTGQASRIAGAVARVSVLVIGEMPDGGAICVDGPPEPVEIAGPAPAATAPPDCCFASVLGEPLAQAASAVQGEGQGGGKQSTVWWRFEPRRLFETLAGD